MKKKSDALAVQLALATLRANGVIVGEQSLKFTTHKDSRGEAEITGHVNGLATAMQVVLENHGTVELVHSNKRIELLVNGTPVMVYRRHWLLARYVYKCSHFHTFDVNTIRLGDGLSDLVNLLFGALAKPA